MTQFQDHPLIDSHCHLNYDYSPKTTETLVEEAKKAGISHLVTIGTEIKTLPEVREISEKFPNVFHTVGVHPHDSESLVDSDLETLDLAARHPKCRGIGEIGLDYHYDYSPREIQKLRLKQQLDLALTLKLPVIIHSRDGEQDLLPLLTSYAKNIPSGQPLGIIHCFTGTIPFGQACLDLGFYISFSGILTFKKAEEIQTAAKIFPLDRILVETDSPYLAPVPYRGKKCEPWMVKNTAEKLAQLKNLSFEEVAQATTANARRVFGI